MRRPWLVGALVTALVALAAPAVARDPVAPPLLTEAPVVCEGTLDGEPGSTDSGRVLAAGATPPDWLAAMPPPRDTPVRYARHRVGAFDGVTLEVESYLPEVYQPDSNRLPTVVIGTPYGALEPTTRPANYARRDFSRSVDNIIGCQAGFFLARGYAVVVWSARGTGASSGCLAYGGTKDERDAAAVLDWIVAQPWSDGTAGAVGHSADGALGLDTAVTGHPALKAVAVNSATHWYDWFRSGAVPQDRAVALSLLAGYSDAPPGTVEATADRALEAPAQPATEECATPAAHFHREVILGDGARLGELGDRWRPGKVESIKAAVLVASGSPVEDEAHITALWEALEHHRVARMALLGAWPHDSPPVLLSSEGLVQEEGRHRQGWFHVQLRWFEHFLRGNDTGVRDEPRITTFDQERVRHQRDRLDDVHWARLYPSAGCLGEDAATGVSVYKDVAVLREGDGFPTAPVCPGGRAGLAPRLVYETIPGFTDEAVRLSGAPRLRLKATIDTPDADFIVSLLAPDAAGGPPQLLTRGILDARHRGGLDRTGVDVTQGVAEEYDIVMEHLDWTLPAGSRLWLDIASTATRVTIDDGASPRVEVHEGPDATVLELPVLGDGRRRPGGLGMGTTAWGGRKDRS